MNPLVLLKRLSEVDSRWHFNPAIPGATHDACRCVEPRSMRLLLVDGQLQGGEALWWMRSEMRERYHALHQTELGWTDRDHLENFTLGSVANQYDKHVTAELVLSTFIAWREVIQS